jgi:hypothetical protein
VIGIPRIRLKSKRWNQALDGICRREEEKPKEKRGMEMVFSFDV